MSNASPGSGLTVTVERLRRLARGASDASGHFPAMYAHVTVEMQQRVASGGFTDPTRTAAFTRTFADLYLTAAGDRAGAARCWRASWDVADDQRLLIAQHLILGINAHVNYDLPQAVVATADETGSLASLRPDFDAVNDVLADAYGQVLRRLGGVSRWTSTAAALGGGRLFDFSLRVARDQAWEAAERLYVLDAPQRVEYLKDLDRLVGILAYLVTRPPLPGRLLLPFMRRCEVRDPRRVTAALLDAR
jgi:hypothetical protein